MIKKLESTVDGYDLCIVGAGPAGLVVAAELAGRGLKICVLESGADKRTGFADALKEVRSDELQIKSNSRERMLGGAGSVWGGLSAPLDNIDFEPREWGEGWPFTGDELTPYWRAASERYRFPQPSLFKQNSGRFLPGLTEKVFAAVRPPYDFARLRSVFDQNNIDLFLEATATQFIQEGDRIVSVTCKTPDGAAHTVKAKMFVLACGGIENARVLLNSKVGNEHDQVGRYFMNHPKGYAGLVRLRRPLSPQSPYLPVMQGGRMVYAGLTLPPELQRSQQLLNSCVQFEPNLGALQRYAFGVWKRLPASLAGLLTMLRPRTLKPRWFADLEPRAENRVTLSDKRDAFGVPLPTVSYALGKRDRATLAALHVQLKTSLAQSGAGWLEGNVGEILAAVTQDASHHLGTTRMGRDPKTSVVDSDCKIHSVSNLYVAGGSVFTTGGCANPTYTIVALAIRLAEHLQKKLGGEPLVQKSHLDKNKISIIGAGKRVAEDVVPALESLDFFIDGIYAQHTGKLLGSHGWYEVQSFNKLDLQQTHLVYVAVPPQALESVLAKLPTTCELIVDTPAPLSKRLHTMLSKFKKVHIAEDSIYLPWIDEVKLKYGTIKTIDCLHSVYRYHGIALLKTLCGGQVRWGWRWGDTIHLRVGNTQVRIIEPRDYAQGKLFINGTEVEGVVPRMAEFKRLGLARMLGEIAQGGEPWPLAQGVNDAYIDRAVHRWGLYASIPSICYGTTNATWYL